LRMAADARDNQRLEDATRELSRDISEVQALGLLLPQEVCVNILVKQYLGRLHSSCAK